MFPLFTENWKSIPYFFVVKTFKKLTFQIFLLFRLSNFFEVFLYLVIYFGNVAGQEYFMYV